MRLIYPALTTALTTASLLLTASPSFGLTPEDVASLGINPGVITFVVNVMACLGIVSIIPNTVAMGVAIQKAMEFGQFWEKFKFMLYASLLFPTAMILTMIAAGLMLGWTNLLSVAVGLNVGFIFAAVPYLAFVSNE